VGSIEPEKLANFTVLGENPVTIDPLEIKDIKVWATIHEGRIFPIKNISEVTSKNLLLPLAAGH
jgi:imidazolonepropionase-like amidohydrolase